MSEIKVKVRRVVGAVSPFWEGGSLRIALPKHLRNKYRKGELDETFVVLETDKGILMFPLKEFVNDPDMKALHFAPLSGLTLQEIARMINEIAERDET